MLDRASASIFRMASLWADEIGRNRKAHFATVMFLEKRRSEHWNVPFKAQPKTLAFSTAEVIWLRKALLDWFENSCEQLVDNKIVPKGKVRDFVFFVAGSAVVTAAEVASACEVSHDTADRWMRQSFNKLMMFNRFKFGNTYYYLATATWMLIHDVYLNHFQLPKPVVQGFPEYICLPKVQENYSGKRLIREQNQPPW